MIEFEIGTTVDCPVVEVFEYVSDMENADRWNSAVVQVQKTSANGDGLGTTYRMVRDLPTGRAENDLVVAEYKKDRIFAVRTLSGPTPFFYRYRFEPRDRSTLLTVDVQAGVKGLGRLASPLLAHGLRAGIAVNLGTLKHILESKA